MILPERAYCGGFQGQSLGPPIKQFRCEEKVLLRARYFMNPAKLPGAMTAGAEHAKHFAIQCEFVDAPRITVRRIKHLMRPRRNADRPGRAVQHRLVERGRGFSGGGDLRRHVSHPRMCLVIVGHVDVDLAQKSAVSIKNLDASVAAIGHIHIARVIGGDTVRCIELPRTSPRLTPRLIQFPSLSILAIRELM